MSAGAKPTYASVQYDSTSFCNLRVGRALLRREFKAAVRMILSGKEGERHEVAVARDAFLKDGDAKVGNRCQGISP